MPQLGKVNIALSDPDCVLQSQEIRATEKLQKKFRLFDRSKSWAMRSRSLIKSIKQLKYKHYKETYRKHVKYSFPTLQFILSAISFQV